MLSHKQNAYFYITKNLLFIKRFPRARDGTRTRDPDLGKVVLHQLSHSRTIGVTGFEPATSWSQTRRSSQAEPHPAPYSLTCTFKTAYSQYFFEFFFRFLYPSQTGPSGPALDRLVTVSSTHYCASTSALSTS